MHTRMIQRLITLHPVKKNSLALRGLAQPEQYLVPKQELIYGIRTIDPQGKLNIESTKVASLCYHSYDDGHK